MIQDIVYHVRRAQYNVGRRHEITIGDARKVDAPVGTPEKARVRIHAFLL